MYALLAQLVEHLTLNQGVRGSSPRWRTNQKPHSHAVCEVFDLRKQPRICGCFYGKLWQKTVMKLSEKLSK